MKRNRYPKNRKKIILCISLCAAALFSVLWIRCRNSRFYSYRPSDFAETAEKLQNPYRGFYRLYQYALSDRKEIVEDTLREHISQNKDYTLCLLEINLKEYADRPLSARALKEIDGILSAWSDANTQIILRFLYDWEGNALKNEPKTREQVMEHMSQAASVVNRHADHVFIMQGIFIGDYAEMHSSAFLGTEDMTALTEHLARVIDPSIYLSVRTPAQWRAITGYSSLPEPFPAHDGSLPARLGLFNDSILASETDLGTYGGDSGETVSGNNLGNNTANREEELAFQETLCRYVPNGGECIQDNHLNNLTEALPALSRMHVSYLNDMYDPDVISKWKNTAYEGDGCFHGRSGYDYISAHLGYRYILTGSDFSPQSAENGEAVLSFTLKNVGFAASVCPFDTFVTVYHPQSGQAETFQVALDLRTLGSGESATVSLSLPAGVLNRGTYQFYLHLRDSVAGDEILLASSPEKTDHGYPLGELSVSWGILAAIAKF